MLRFTSSKFLSTSANKEDSMEERVTPLKSILDKEDNDGDCGKLNRPSSKNC